MHRLDPTSAEAVWVGREFHTHGLMCESEVVAVYRLQCVTAARQFIINRSHIWANRIDKSKPAMERLLWHGCSSLKSLESILATAFRPLYSQQDGALNFHG